MARVPRSYVGPADVFGVYFPPSDKVHLVPIDAFGMGKASLRIEPSRNNQPRGIRMAADYELDRRTPERLATLVPTASAAAA
jgi:hypothetical protein